MKAFLTTTILLIINLFVYTQQRWEKTYGTPLYDESFWSVVETYDDAYVISGSHNNPVGNWIFKTDVNGNILWEKILKWENVTVGCGWLDKTKDGGIVIARSITSHEHGNWPMIVKLDSCGEKTWCRVFPQYDHEYGWYEDVLVLENNDILALCYLDELIQGQDLVYLDYIDQYGNLLWRKAFAKKENYPLIVSPHGRALMQNDKDYYIGGDCYWPYPDNQNHVWLRPMFIAIDSMFNEKWLLPFGVSDSVLGEARCLTKINDTLFLGGGFTFDEGMDVVSLLAIFDHNGLEISHTYFPNHIFGNWVIENIIRNIIKINNGLYMGVANWGNQDEWGGGEIIFDTSGNMYNKKYNENHYWGKGLTTADSNYLIGRGYHEPGEDWDILLYKINEELESVPYDTNQYTYDSLCPHPISSGIIDLSDCMIVVNTDEVPTPEEYYEILKSIPIVPFPNPAKGKITFALENTKYHKSIILQCFDMFGSWLGEQSIVPGQLEAETDVRSWRSGMYVAVVRSNGKVVGKCKFVVE